MRMTSLKSNDQIFLKKYIAKCGNKLSSAEIRLSFKFMIRSLIPWTWGGVGKGRDV